MMQNVVVHPRSASGNPWIRSLVALLMTLLLICNFATVSTYNVDTNYPILYPNSAVNSYQYFATKFARAYFGYSVLLHRDSQRNSTWLFIGAPRGNYTKPSRSQLRYIKEPGVVYRCALPTGPCVEIEPAVIQDEQVPVFHVHGRVMKEGSWFGATMAIEKNNDFLTICAPRTIINIQYNMGNEELHTMHGMCYDSKVFWNTTVNMARSYVEHYDFSELWWYDPMHGFSITYAPTKDKNVINRIIGEPNHSNGGSVSMVRLVKPIFREIYRKTKDLSYDNISQFGYSTTAGYYFNQYQLLYAAGDPSWKHLGQVAIIEPRQIPLLITVLRGSDIGERFGASLATGDLNQDGLDDLVVGAPHWKNDNGRVHIYLGTSEGELVASAILEGTKEDALFGYAIACGDLDGDGFSDIIVGAPWEESGAIYIYNSDASLKDKVKPTASQRITMEKPFYNLPNLDIRTFGFSISEPIDIDNNGYVDIAVGAYKSGHAVILRSNPVVRTSLIIHTVPDILQRDINNFLVQVCVEYRGHNLATRYAFNISLTIDENHKRTKITSLMLSSANTLHDKCVNTTVALSKNILDFIEPITIYAQHKFTHKYSLPRVFCATCPVERKSDTSQGAQALLSFDIGCGTDRVCNSNISAVVRFSGVRNNNSWVIGSNDIILEASLMNHAEPSYLTTIVFTLPLGIVLRSILPSCQEDTVGDNLTITCNAGNPLGKDELKIMKLDLDMRHFTDGSLHGRVLEFITEIQTRSVNHGIRVIKSLLTLQSEAFLSLNGRANEESYYLPNLDKEQLNVSFQHTYQILKSGATPIKEARLLVNVPTSVNGSSSLVFLHKPRIYIAGGYRDCSSYGIDVIDTQQNDFQDEIASDVSNMNLFNIKPSQNESHLLRKRDINNHATLAARVVQTLYAARMIKSENSTDILTRQHIVHLNCSSPNVNCSMVYCDLSALKTQQDIGKLTMRLILNVTKLKDAIGLSNETNTVRFSTEAHVEIIQPANRTAVAGDIRNDINLTTEFHSIATTQELQLWVVLVSISLGLILLCIVIILLYMTGFFRRTMKEELTALKDYEMTEDMNKDGITDTSE